MNNVNFGMTSKSVARNVLSAFRSAFGMMCAVVAVLPFVASGEATLDVLKDGGDIVVTVPSNSHDDTGFAPNNNTRVVFDITVRGVSESWFGTTDDGSGNWWRGKVFGVAHTTCSGQTFQLTHMRYLFADNKVGGPNIKADNSPVRLHSCQIYDDGVLVKYA
jgi:hypothetical protein